MRPRLARPHGVAAVEASYARSAHAQEEQRHREGEPEEDREHDIRRYSENRHDDGDAEIERDLALSRRAALEQAQRRRDAPRIDMSHRHDHDDGGQHGARQTGDEGEADQDRREQRPGVDHPGTPGMTAERAVRRAGPDVDAAGYAAGGRGDSVGQAERTSMRLLSAWRSPGAPASRAHSIASIAAISASATAPGMMMSARAARR